MRCSAMESRPSAVLFEHGVGRLLGIRRQSTRAESRRSSLIACERLRLAVLEWRANASHALTRTCDPLRSISDGLSDAGHDKHLSVSQSHACTHASVNAVNAREHTSTRVSACMSGSVPV